MRLSMLGVVRLLLPVATIGMGFIGSNAIAAEQIILKYGPMRAPVSVAELSAFAETGEMSVSLQSYLGLAKQNPEDMRDNLTKSISVSPRFLDRVLNHRLGERLLDEMGEIIQTPSGRASGQALRAALVLSASGDGEITLLETLKNYPAQVVEVEVGSLIKIYRKLSFLEKLPF